MGELLNLIGLSMGIALYAMLLVMVVRTGHDPLLLATAILGLVWNVCALPVYELLKIGMVGPFRVFTAIGFSALGLLPSVAVHSVLRRDRDHLRGGTSRTLVAAAYGVSGVAAVLQFVALGMGAPLPSEVGMRLLTYAFVALAVPLAVATRGQQGSRRALWAAALSIFAVSALHLSQFHQGEEPSWAVELLGHHASLPLAVAILYQDFPFALADLFLKRALTLLMVVSLAFMSLVLLGGTAGTASGPLASAVSTGLAVSLWVATAFLFPALQRFSAWFVDTVVLRRPDYTALRSSLNVRIFQHEDIPALLDDVCEALRPALSASVVRWREQGTTSDGLGDRQSRHNGPESARIEVPLAEPPSFTLDVQGLTGGRRLLSDDRAFLEGVAAQVGRRIDGIRITRERFDRESREQEIAKLATEAELRALRAQVNPHFLFNALTTIGYLIQTSPPRALDTLMRLTSLLRGVLRSEGEFTTLGRELELIESYLDIESARFEERLRVTIRVPDHLRALRMPALLLQPLVENAIKHGIAPERHGGDLHIEARLDGHLGHEHRASLVLTVRDSGAGSTEGQLRLGRRTGVGLRTLERRLAVQYGTTADLSIQTAPGIGTTAVLTIPAETGDREPAVARGVH